MSSWHERLRPRLALRIYLVGLAQFAAVAAGFWAVLSLTPRPTEGPAEAHLRYIAFHLSRSLAVPGELEAEIGRVGPGLCENMTVLDPDGRVAGGSRPERPDRLRCAPASSPPDDAIFCARQPLPFPDGRQGWVECASVHRPPFVGWKVVVAVLAVVGVSSLLLARTLTRPLQRLSTVARAFGRGDWKARVDLRRGDELGDVAQSFDEMANRVADLLRAEKELLANVSHELRTPLARIRVALDLAAEGDAEMARESLLDIAGDLDELERLISDVLTAARLDLGDGTALAGLPPLRRQSIDLRALLEQSASRLRASHPSRTLRLEAEGPFAAIDGDPVLLRRAVDNLLENAHRYTERPDAPVSLTAREADGGVVIEVRDQGVGISADDLANVFRPFFRADRSRARATGGLGLGLALTRRIVEAHGGRIELFSRVDEGTRAQIWLPTVTS